MDRKLTVARALAINKRIISSPDQLQLSTAKNKRFAITNKDGKRVNFGLWPFSGAGTFIDHNDNKVQSAWRARHSKILLKDGTPSYLKPGTAEYYSWNILW
jgi:hypothetical protein